MRCTSHTIAKNGKRFGPVCKRNCIKGSDFCYQHNPLNKLDDTTCAICLEDIKDPLPMISCTHVFCKECINNSIAHKNIACPCCRKTVNTDIIGQCLKVKLGKIYADRFYLRLEMNWNPKWQKPQTEWTETMINRFVRVFPVSL